MNIHWIAALACTLCLTACAPQGVRTVDALDGPQFVSMSRALRPAMLKKGLVDTHGDWYSPVFSHRPENAGKVLVDRLSPAFRFPGARGLPPTFRAMLTSDAKVTLDGSRAVIEQGLSIIHLELVAVADWNNDGTDDWLILCRVRYTDSPRRFREYYLTVTDLNSPVLYPVVQAVREQVYGKVTVLHDAAAGELAETGAEEFLQGQTTVTQKPDGNAVRQQLEAGSSLTKRTLSR